MPFRFRRSVGLQDLSEMRARMCESAGCQIVRFTNLPRGLAYPVGVECDGDLIAYAAIRTYDDEEALVEFFVEKPYEGSADEIGRLILQETGAPWVEAQTNLPLLHSLFKAVSTTEILGPTLFKNGGPVNLNLPGATYRRKSSTDRIFPHESEPEGDWVIEADGQVVATGGYLTHYNPPYADLYMEVAPEFRQLGFGSFLVGKLRETCLEAGLIPAARCNADNEASRRCLLKAGMSICGQLVSGSVDATRLS
ncbi:MAG: GNAT family N-acetyltransferase [Armatimonadetes bacterium]|nr:GNAT family N-acetyltransferase [Armatimonadota bacterium]